MDGIDIIKPIKWIYGDLKTLPSSRKCTKLQKVSIKCGISEDIYDYLNGLKISRRQGKTHVGHYMQ